MKQKFGENTVARSVTGLVAEGCERVWALDELRQYGENRIAGPAVGGPMG